MATTITPPVSHRTERWQKTAEELSSGNVTIDSLGELAKDLDAASLKNLGKAVLDLKSAVDDRNAAGASFEKAVFEGGAGFVNLGRAGKSAGKGALSGAEGAWAGMKELGAGALAEIGQVFQDVLGPAAAAMARFFAGGLKDVGNAAREYAELGGPMLVLNTMKGDPTEYDRSFVALMKQLQAENNADRLKAFQAMGNQMKEAFGQLGGAGTNFWRSGEEMLNTVVNLANSAGHLAEYIGHSALGKVEEGLADATLLVKNALEAVANEIRGLLAKGADVMAIFSHFADQGVDIFGGMMQDAAASMYDFANIVDKPGADKIVAQLDAKDKEIAAGA